MQVKEFKVEGMSCKNCVKHVTEALKSTKGVFDVNVFLDRKSAEVKIDETVFNFEDAKFAVEEAGYNLVE